MSEIEMPEFWCHWASHIGFIDWCGDAYELTPRGDMYLTAWLKKQIAEAQPSRTASHPGKAANL